MISPLSEAMEQVRTTDTVGVEGRVRAAAGMTIEASGLPVAVGSLCEVGIGATKRVPAEVIGLRDGATLLMPLGPAEGLATGQAIRYVTRSQKIAVTPALLGRVVDSMGRPIDGGPSICADESYPLHASPPNSAKRPRIDQILSVGVRSIDALLTVGRGQRLGIFAGTGVGKSVLLGMMARHTSADVAVIGLVGERGREVGDFIAKELGAGGLKRSVLVVSTSDQSGALRVRAGFAATAIAEYFRDQGADVLLLMDSITRLAMAARQVGLAAGEPPATKGYPPSVFAMLPRLLERSGRSERGSITGLYTVLVEGDDPNEPISDAVRGILDGHVWLSRKLANRGQFPAVSVNESLSRVMVDVVDESHRTAATRIRRLIAMASEIEDLVNIGAYVPGANAECDVAIRMKPAIEAFLTQGMDEACDFDVSRAGLLQLAEQSEQVSAKTASSPART